MKEGSTALILKEFLSNEGFLDEIEKGISKTVQAVYIEPNGVIVGGGTGEVKVREEKQQQLNIMDDLLFQLDNVYSGGNLAELNVKLKEFQSELDRLDQAWLHLAWKLSQDMEQIDQEKANLPREQIEELQR